MFRYRFAAAAVGAGLLFGTAVATADKVLPIEGRTLSLGLITGVA